MKPSEQERAGLTSGRVEAFSDAVIAIAATLLVIELHVPEPGENLGRALLAEAPAVAAFAVSFTTILIFWINHHAMFAVVAQVDRGVLYLNGLLLLAITFISFPTAVLGRALAGDEDPRAAALFYTAVLTVASAAFVGIWVYLRRHPHLLRQGQATAAAAVRRGLFGTGLYAASILLAFLNGVAALTMVFFLALFFALPTPAERGRSRSDLKQKPVATGKDTGA